MPRDDSRKNLIREIQSIAGEPYNVARHYVDGPTLRFDPSWLNLDVVLCPVCRGDNVDWLVRGTAVDPPLVPGEMTPYVRPTDPGFCFDCFAQGQSRSPDAWRLPNGVKAGRCLHCGEPPISETHLAWNDGKHRRKTNFDSSLVPEDGRWYRYECAKQHYWVSAPVFVTATTPEKW